MKPAPSRELDGVEDLQPAHQQDSEGKALTQCVTRITMWVTEHPAAALHLSCSGVAGVGSVCDRNNPPKTFIRGDRIHIRSDAVLELDYMER